MEDNKEEEDDDNYHNMYPGYDDTAMGVDNEDQEAADGPADDDLGRAITDAKEECETEKEKEKLEQMLKDHKTLLYPTCEDGHKKLGATLDLLQWKAENGVTDSAFSKLLVKMKNLLPRGLALNIARIVSSDLIPQCSAYRACIQILVLLTAVEDAVIRACMYLLNL